MVPMGKERSVLMSEIAGLVVNLIINTMLIPRMASTGAAIGTLAAEFTVLMVQYFAMRGEISHAFHAVSYWKIILGLVAGTVCSFWIGFLGLSNFLTLAFTSIAFFGAYAAVLLFMREWLACDLMNQFVKKFNRMVGKSEKRA